ncbi:uncharacterized protein METZ01_LOCUS57530 [marine metagenome]|uniref:Uncharacterized protein n=1 Tax=marine metagenome TaxID=408172 RepID=A0A381SL06_9ZZZZ
MTSIKIRLNQLMRKVNSDNITLVIKQSDVSAQNSNGRWFKCFSNKSF